MVSLPPKLNARKPGKRVGGRQLVGLLSSTRKPVVKKKTVKKKGGGVNEKKVLFWQARSHRVKKRGRGNRSRIRVNRK